jgi:GNAT superfamily N-acetyltransferase
MQATVREMRDDDIPQVHAMYRSVFGDDALQRWTRRWRWQFVDLPWADQATGRCWVAELDREVLGFLASFPVRLKLREQETMLRYPCDLMVSDRARGKRLGERLMRAYIECGDHELANALDYTPNAQRIYERLGYRQVPIKPLRIRPYNLPALAKAYLGDAGEGGWRPAAIRRLGLTALPALSLLTAFLRRLRRPARNASIRLEEVREPGEEFDHLWQRLKAEFTIATVRDRAFLQWRYAEPAAAHRLFIASDRSGPLGWVALNENVRRGLSVGRIMDLFVSPSRPDVATQLLAQALEVLEARGVDLISCLGLHPRIQQVVGRYLFVRPPMLQLPAQLLWRGDPMLEDTVYEAEAWHLSYSDGDEGFG